MELVLQQAQALAGGTVSPSVPTVVSPAVSPGERLMMALQKASGVNLGNPAAPVLMMVMDPTCPHCRKTWRMIREKVLANALQVRLIPITRNGDDPDQEHLAARLLQVADPLGTWDKYVAGDETQLAGNADLALVANVRANHKLIDDWHVKNTPFLVYRGHDGTVKILEGEPEKPAALFADLLP